MNNRLMQCGQNSLSYCTNGHIAEELMCRINLLLLGLSELFSFIPGVYIKAETQGRMPNTISG